jgi:hypothetical protein
VEAAEGPPLPVKVIPLVDPDEVEEDEEDLAAAGVDEEQRKPALPPDGESDASKVFKSPWFWVSMGVVAGVVGSVMIVSYAGE